MPDVRPLTHSSTHQSLSPMHTHTLHSLRKCLVHLSKSPTGTQGGARGLLQQLHSKLTQPLHSVILGDPPCGHPHLQTDTESSSLRTTHNTTLSHCVSCKNTHHCVVPITLGTYLLQTDHAHIHLHTN